MAAHRKKGKPEWTLQRAGRHEPSRGLPARAESPRGERLQED